MDDPFDWDVERVVREFCTPNPSIWSIVKDPSKLPRFDKLADLLRENDVDGELIVKHDDLPDLCSSIGITHSKHRWCFVQACKRFQRRSPKLKLEQERQVEDGQDNSLSDAPFLDSPKPAADDFLIRQQLLAERDSFQPLSSPRPLAVASNVPPQPEQPAKAPPLGVAFGKTVPEQPREHTTSLIPALPNVVQEPAPKKRRIVPTFVSSQITTSRPQHQSQPYLGESGFSIFHLLDETSPEPGTSVAREGFTILGQQVPPGRRRQINNALKSYLLPQQKPIGPRHHKADVLVRDPGMNEVLPALGESDDDEYDSETWEELEKDLKRKERHKKRTGLTNEQVNGALDEAIRQIITKWQKKRLPKLAATAYDLWHHPKGRFHMIRGSIKDLGDLNKRLAALRERVLEGSYTKVKEVRDTAEAFEATVQDQQTIEWKLSVLKNSKAPEKPSAKDRRGPTKRKRAKSVNSDEDEILTSESEGEMDFVVHDADEHIQNHVDTSPRSVDNSADNDAIMVDANDDDVPMDISDNDQIPFGASNGADQHALDDVPMDISDNDQIPVKASIGAEQQSLDDTSAGAKPATSNAPRSIAAEPHTPATSRHSNVIDLTSPRPGSPVNQPPRDMFSTPSKNGRAAPPRRGPLDLAIDDLSEAERAVAEYINDKLTPLQMNSLFSLARDSQPDLIMSAHILRDFTTASQVDEPEGTVKADLRLACEILHLFCRWNGHFRNPNPARQFMKLPQLEREAFAKAIGTEDFRRFISFLGRLSDRFEWQALDMSRSRAMPEPQSHKEQSEQLSRDSEDIGSSSEEDPEVPPSQKKRRAKARDKVAANLRMENKAKQKSLDERRARLRSLLDKGGMSHAQQHTIINETKSDADGFIYVDSEIATKIQDHQIQGVRFLWDSVVLRTDGTSAGCLLAHTMGLGKTMQVITFLVAIAQAAQSSDETVRSQIPEDLRKSQTLILCPPGLVVNWVDELLQWTPEDSPLGKIFSIDSSYSVTQRDSTIQGWKRQGGVLVLGNRLAESYVQALSEPESFLSVPNLVVLDEAHGIKNPNTALHKLVHGFTTRARIALTGSPLANNVQEYHSLINWVAPRYLSDLQEFRATYQNPIELGFKSTSTPYQRRKALKTLKALSDHVAPKVQRKTISAISHSLPEKIEWIITVPLTPIQKTLYEMYMSHINDAGVTKEETARYLGALSNLSLLCTHPQCFKTQLETQKSKGPAQPGKASPSTQGAGDDDAQFDTYLRPDKISEMLRVLNKSKTLKAIENSHKTMLLLSILEEARKVGDRVLVFSQSRPTLDFIQAILHQRKITCYRLDGMVPTNRRQEMIKDFNTTNIDVFLVSTRAGGVGLNITAANRVVIFDFRWNPQHEQQAIGRAFRLGQKKRVYVYRFFAGGTFEDELMDLNIFKTQLASSVVDKKISVPKSQNMRQMFKMPTEPQQQVIEGHRGRDQAIDRILDEPSLRGCVRSITTTETFEEDDADAALTQQEIEEAASMVEYERLRRANKPIPPHLQGFQTVTSTIRDLPALQVTLPEVPGASQQGMPGPGPQDGSIVTPTTPQPLQGQLQQPILGASTNYSSSGRSAIEGVPHFKEILASLFTRDAVIPKVRMNRAQSAVELAEAVERVTTRGSDERNKLKAVIMECAGSTRFVTAVVEGMDGASPTQVAIGEPQEIKNLREYLDSLTKKDWDDKLSSHYKAREPEKQNLAATSEAARTIQQTPFVPSQWQPERTTSHPSPADLDAFIQHRRKNKDARLPGWAQNAVSKGGSEPPATTRTPVPAAPPAHPASASKQSHKPRPFPKSPFT